MPRRREDHPCCRRILQELTAVVLVATPTDAGTIWGTAAQMKFVPRWTGQSPARIAAGGRTPL